MTFSLATSRAVRIHRRAEVDPARGRLDAQRHPWRELLGDAANKFMNGTALSLRGIA